MNIQKINTDIELNQFFYASGTGSSGWSHYFYLKPFMYRIDCFYPHNYKSIKEYKSKIDNLDQESKINFDTKDINKQNIINEDFRLSKKLIFYN